MDIISIILIAVGLSMDSFSVSIINGCTLKELNTPRILSISLFFALFQAFMPVLGWLSGLRVEKYIQELDHWIVFLLLSFIGLKMIVEGMKKDNPPPSSVFPIKKLIGQSLATSIDAFAVGVSFSLLELSLITPVMIIGLVTFGFAMLGLFLGKYFNKLLGQRADVIGGIILIGMGIKILYEHLNY